ncbi:RNA-splicing factor [Coemansia sp. RSA 455]|nr:RNA-splicing factor [Coemansia sp. RSA 455]
MYNGIGLNTPRGSGTSGHVVRSMSALKPGQGRQTQQYSRDHITNAKPVDKGIIEHERRRQVEVKCLELQDELETQGKLDDTEIEERVDKLRSQLLESIDQLDFTGARPIKSFETQKLAEAKSKENARLASALRVEEEYVEGAAFDRELQELKRQRRLLEKERDLDRQRDPALKANSRAVEDGEPGEIEDLEPPHMPEEPVAAPTTAETMKQTLNVEPIYSDDESSDGCIGE